MRQQPRALQQERLPTWPRNCSAAAAHRQRRTSTCSASRYDEYLTGQRPASVPSGDGGVSPSTLAPGPPTNLGAHHSWMPSAKSRGAISHPPNRRWRWSGPLPLTAGHAEPDCGKSQRAHSPLPSCCSPAGWAWKFSDSILHPLPRQRFVALMASPSAANDPNLPIVKGSPRCHQQSDRAQRGSRRRSDDDLVDGRVGSWDAESADRCGASARCQSGAHRGARRPQADDAMLDLAVLDATTARVIRTRSIRVGKAELGSIPEKASGSSGNAARRPFGTGTLEGCKDELSRVPSTAYQLFTKAED